jgi:hypothetical protein
MDSASWGDIAVSADGTIEAIVPANNEVIDGCRRIAIGSYVVVVSVA